MSNRITLETNFAAGADGLKNVSLITTGIEAAGHGIYLDEKTAETAMQKLLGRSIKSYLKHDGAGGDRLGQEIGFFSGIYRAGQQIKAGTFQFLESFKREAGSVADRIMELANKAPDQFGVSLVLEYLPVWVMPDGSEMQARRGEPAPVGALYGHPAMRVLDVISADFVGRPAANPNGLLSADNPAPVDAAAQEKAQPMSDKISLDQATLAAKDGEIAALTAQLAEKDAAHVTALAAAVEAKTAELGAVHTAALAAKDAEIAALGQACVAELAKRDEAHTAALSALTEKLTDSERYDARKLGVAPLRIAQAQTQLSEAALGTAKDKWEHYQKMPKGSKEAIGFAQRHFAELAEYSKTLSAA